MTDKKLDALIAHYNYDCGVSMDDALIEAFHDKNIQEPEEVFAHLSTLIPCWENAFLFRK